MSKLESVELAITDIYDQYNSNKVAKLYLNLYKVPDEVVSNEDKMLFLFAVFHQSLNNLLCEVNFRFQTGEKLSADLICDLINLSNSIDALQNSAEGTIFSFWVLHDYWFFLYRMPDFFAPGREAFVPKELGTVYLQKYKTIFQFTGKPSTGVEPERPIAEVIQMISTRNAEFEAMRKDEKLSVLNQAVEYYLKKDRQYIPFDQYGAVFCGLIGEDALKDYRKATHCFRHGKQEDIAKRAAYSDAQKDFLVDFGVSVCNAIGNQKAK